ncbi:VC0807 family protein [Streptosporangium sp. NPDC051023]|uniref:VC0807 family protein n=1 Tax=Streptosporangium sp. NPDC051023 TaxID=3155410 RepID=UPI0034507948
MKKMLPALQWDVLPAVAAYYVLRWFGLSEYAALLAATCVGALRVVYVAARERRLDGFAACTGLVFALGLVLSFLTGDERFMLVIKSVTTTVLALVLAGTCLAGRPAAFGIAKRFGAEDEATAVRWDVLYTARPAFRRVYLVMTLTWAVALLAESSVRIPLVYLLPVDVMAGLSPMLLIGTLVLLGVWSARYGGRAERALTSAPPSPVPPAQP